MPLEKSHLTDTERQRVQDYRRQGFTFAAIAKEVDCSVSQVWRYLRSLDNPPKSILSLVPIVESQYRIILLFEQSSLSGLSIAARLGIDASILLRELAGTKPMSTQRIGAIKKILQEDMPDEKSPKKRGRPAGDGVQGTVGQP